MGVWLRVSGFNIGEMVNMDIEQLRSFCAVAKHKSFRKAAETLNITQPGVSRRIKSLENELGVTFFLRTPQSVIMTKIGKDFLPYAERTLKIISEATKKALEGEKDEKLIVAGTPTICLKLLPEVIKRFRSYYSASIHVYTSSSQQVFDMLLDQTIDFGFVATIVSNPLVKYEKIYTEEICCVGHPDFVSQYLQDGRIKKTVPTIITNLNTPPWSVINDYLINSHLYEVIIETQLTPVSMKLAQAGIGLAFIPYSDTLNELMNGELIKVNLVDFKLPSRPVYLISNKDKPPSEKETNFKKILIDYLSYNSFWGPEQIQSPKVT